MSDHWIFYNRYVPVRSKEHNKDAYSFVISYMVYSQKLARILFWMISILATSKFWKKKKKKAVAYMAKSRII
jgi:hypothetical protein